MVFNITNIQGLTDPQATIEISKSLLTPSIIVYSVVIMLVMLLIGLFSFDNSKGKSKFFIVWLVSFIFVALIITLLSLLPELLPSLANLI